MFNVLTFGRSGGRDPRGEVSLAADGGERVRVERVLRERMVMSPGRFVVPVRGGGGPEVTVEWESAVRSAGVAYLSVAGRKVVACLLLGGLDELVDEMTTVALQEEIGGGPGDPLWPAFRAVRRDHRRPLLAVFRVGEGLAGGEAVERALGAVEWALGAAYFGLCELGRREEPAERAEWS